MENMQAKFGLSLSNRSVLFGYTDLDDILDSAQIAEESGLFHSVWVGDNLLGKPRVEAIVTLSAIATRTSQVRLGTICMASFPVRHPIPLAIQMASLDVLSKGRTIFGVCNGITAKAGGAFAQEFEVMGVASSKRVSRLIENITMMRRLWTEEKTTFNGEFHSFTELELLPKPVQQPPPIFIAANPNKAASEAVVERILRRVAQYGDGWQIDDTTPEAFRRFFDQIKEYAAQEGRDPDKLESSVHLMVNINDDRDQAFAEAGDYFVHYYPSMQVTKERAEIWLAFGSPDEVVQKIQNYLDAGCTLPVLRFASSQPKEQLQRCIEHVLPAFKK